MHNGEKVGSSAVGELIRMNMKVAIKPFPKGNYLISKAHHFSKHFLYGSERYEQLWKLSNKFSGVHGECFNLYMDLNGTQIYSRQSLL